MPGRQPVRPKTFLNHIKTLDDIWERLRVDATLHAFMHELERLAPQPPERPSLTTKHWSD